MTENHEFERGRDGRSTDIETGGGTPGWLASHLNYCSRCGSRLRFGAVDGEHRERLVCDTLRSHRLRQPSPGRDRVPDHR